MGRWSSCFRFFNSLPWELRYPEDTLTVILPEFVVAHWWEYLLHNQMAVRLKAALLFRPGVAVMNLPQHLRGRVPQPRPSP